jgi:hypothetical protein
VTPQERCALPGNAPLFAAPETGARDVCLTCPLVIQCATRALQRRESWGIWGGLDMDPRRPHRPTDRKRHRGDVPHGSMTAWKRHERAREPLCDPCRDARASHTRARRDGALTA